jgi:hypothetical protein
MILNIDVTTPVTTIKGVIKSNYGVTIKVRVTCKKFKMWTIDTVT